jgi:hypothetical protein
VTAWAANPRQKARLWQAIAAAFLLATLTGTSSAVLAQATPPVRLIAPRAPEPTPAVPAAETTPAPVPDAPPTAAPRAPEIEVSAPLPVAIDSVGLIDESRGGFPGTLWNGSQRSVIDRLIGEIPPGTTSPAMRALARRLLTTAATVPSSTGEPPKDNFVAVRARQLMAMGEVPTAASLIQLIPTRSEDSTLARLYLDALWLSYDYANACSLVRSQVARFTDLNWQRALVFCQALNGEHARAQLGIDLLREQGGEDDVTFRRLIAALSDDPRAKVDSLANPEPIHLAMLRAARQQIPANAGGATSLAVLRTIATSPNAATELRLAAAEKTERAGVLATETLAQLYDAMTFSADDLAKASSIAESDKGPRGRAVLYRAAKAQSEPAARAEALQRLWSAARKSGWYPTAVRLSLPLLKDIPPTVEADGFAAEAARANLFAGRRDDAGIWIGSTAGTGGLVSPTATSLQPLLWLAGAKEQPDAARLTAWRALQTRTDAAAAGERIAMLAALVAGMGGSADAALGGLPATGARASTSLPPAAYWLLLDSAAAQGRVGETALLALAILGPEGTMTATPHLMPSVLRALRGVGLEATAQSLAVETAINAGL